MILVQNPLVLRDITILRDKSTTEENFRLGLKRISFVLASKISEEFKLQDVDVETPLEITSGHRISDQIILVPVLRAGLSMVEAFVQMIPDAKVGHIGLERDEETLQPKDYYYKTPRNLDSAKVIILDPMLATGGSAVASVEFLKNKGAKNISLACLISSPEGVAKMKEEHPEVEVYTAALDRELNENGYIVPGLGDAGDRTFGTY